MTSRFQLGVPNRVVASGWIYKNANSPWLRRPTLLAMRRDSRLGRVLWIALLVLLGGYVVADFVRSPFLAPSGSAAVRPTQVTLWVPAVESGGETGAVLQQAAAMLDLEGHTTTVKSLAGGSSQAVANLLSRRRAGAGANLLVVTSTTLAQIAHDRRDQLIPGVAEEAVSARALLWRAQPLAVLERDPLTLALPASGAEISGTQLLASMRADPEQQLVAIADDPWSRVQLAALVDRAGIDGNVRFSSFQSGAETALALEDGSASLALASRGSLREDFRSGRLHELAWPFDHGRAPRSWVALVAPPGLPAAQLARLRRWVDDLLRNPLWRTRQRRDGRQPGAPGARRPTALLRDGFSRADRQELLAQRVEDR